MNKSYDQVTVRGRATRVPATVIQGRKVTVCGRWLKIATLKDEALLEGVVVSRPDDFVLQVRSSGLGADIFTFADKLEASGSSQPYPFEWDNAAVIETSDYKRWWEGLPQEARKNVRRAAKKGVVVKNAVLDDDFARGIKRIYDESPLRQGRPFWHYGKDLERVKAENGTYIDRSDLIGAYLGGELIGFMKWVYVDDVARIIQILSLSAHQDKRPMNALIAKAAEICHAKGIRYLAYGRFTYGNKGDSSIAEFKRRMGFEQMNFRRYHIGLTVKGRLLMRMGFHRGLIGMLPWWAIKTLLAVRSNWLAWRTRARARFDATATQ
jgi:hypothetical protein